MKNRNLGCANTLKLGCLASVVIVVLMLIFKPDAIDRANRQPPTAAPARQPVAAPKPMRGENCYLNSGGSSVLLPRDKEASSEMYSFIHAKNNEALAQLALSGRMLVLPKNSRAVVLETGIMTYRVRVAEGKGAGQEGLIATEHVHASPQ